MLVLSRKLGEQVMISHNICLTVVAIRGNQVRLGLSVPEQALIRRKEINYSPQNQRKQHR